MHLSALQGKHVVVVGAGKTAHDVATAVSKVAASTTLVARRGHWMAPQIVLGKRWCSLMYCVRDTLWWYCVRDAL